MIKFKNIEEIVTDITNISGYDIYITLYIPDNNKNILAHLVTPFEWRERYPLEDLGQFVECINVKEAIGYDEYRNKNIVRNYFAGWLEDYNRTNKGDKKMKGTAEEIKIAEQIKRDFLEIADAEYSLNCHKEIQNLTASINIQLRDYVALHSIQTREKMMKNLRTISHEEIRKEYLNIKNNDNAADWIDYGKNDDDIEDVLISKFIDILFKGI